MDITTMFWIALAAAALVLLSAALLSATAQGVFRALVNAALGLSSLLLVNATSAYTGLTLGVTLPNAAVVTILGIPGLGLLFLMHRVLT